jgi:cytosine/adenosine deaminase-related metal-dependent hydrolase
VGDILIEGDRIVRIAPSIEAPGVPVLDASRRLVTPGLINAHYHSHDVLCRGLFEELPLEFWLLYTPPMGANRSLEEVRLRTLVGAVESLRAGITTVQDLLNLVPFEDAYVDAVLGAYADVGIRNVHAFAMQDVPPIESVLGLAADMPAELQALYGAACLPRQEQIDFVLRQMERHPAGGRLHWALGPSAPQRCSAELLEATAALSRERDLPVYTHVYETRGQALLAREKYRKHGGSFIRYLKDCGLLGPRLSIAHSVWIARDEMRMMREADAAIVLNHLSNLKIKSGIAPVSDLHAEGVRLAMGCDNCSGSDVQNLFQAMKLFCLFHSVGTPEPTPGLAPVAIRHATEGSARTAGLGKEIGAIRPGMRADLVLLDLDDIGWVPFNSAARQLVYTETGRSVREVIVDGRIVLRDNRIQTIDEEALRREVAGLMKHFIADYETVRREREAAVPYLLAAHRRVWSADLPLARFLARTP